MGSVSGIFCTFDSSFAQRTGEKIGKKKNESRCWLSIFLFPSPFPTLFHLVRYTIKAGLAFLTIHPHCYANLTSLPRSGQLTDIQSKAKIE